MHLTGVGRSAGKPSGTQALVQESARAGAHAETGTSTTLDECTCIDHVLNIIDILSNITIPRSWPSEMNSSLQMQMNSSLRASVS